jgi:hypothetical protein
MIQLITKGIDHYGCIDQKRHDQRKYIHLELMGSFFKVSIMVQQCKFKKSIYTTLHKFGDANPKPFISNLEVQGLLQ